ncbi:hypothetical protein [Nonomuraea recticatena]|uniref:hypothetical protein n=1 Tax=Nonomuraea recticatena TaxID=46178 RepID=UPI0036081EB1
MSGARWASAGRVSSGSSPTTTSPVAYSICLASTAATCLPQGRRSPLQMSSGMWSASSAVSTPVSRSSGRTASASATGRGSSSSPSSTISSGAATGGSPGLIVTDPGWRRASSATTSARACA